MGELYLDNIELFLIQKSLHNQGRYNLKETENIIEAYQSGQIMPPNSLLIEESPDHDFDCAS